MTDIKINKGITMEVVQIRVISDLFPSHMPRFTVLAAIILVVTLLIIIIYYWIGAP